MRHVNEWGILAGDRGSFLQRAVGERQNSVRLHRSWRQGIYAPGDAPQAGKVVLLPSRTELPIPKNPLPKSPGHFDEWVGAIRTGEPAMSNFDYASRLTETVLLGNLAICAAKPIQWDAKHMKASGVPELGALIRPEYHHGYVL